VQLIKKSLPFLLIIPFLFFQCGESADELSNDQDSLSKENKEKAKLFKFKGRLFSIPSPAQTALLLEEVKVIYNKEILNSVEKVKTYNTAYKQAVNLGVYGADLGYINIFGKNNDATPYFVAVKKLSDQLNILNALSSKTLDKAEKLKGNKDSLIHITSKIYQDADSYLSDSQRDDIAVLILAGGWTESLYLMTKEIAQKRDSKLIERIGQQQFPLNNLIELLRPYYGTRDNEYDNLLEKLMMIAEVFDGVQITYEYQKPDIRPNEKLAIIKSKSETVITEYQLKTITKLVGELRAEIVN